SGTFGNDVITDFDATSNLERIDLRGVSSITSWLDLRFGGHLAANSNTVVINDQAGNTITLEGVLFADLDATDFIF
ncbi:MAG: calcium-binding protein, partial [Pseudomonadota bacterium]